eukprot:5900256-Prymnesium_polylepis.1
MLSSARYSAVGGTSLSFFFPLLLLFFFFAHATSVTAGASSLPMDTFESRSLPMDLFEMRSPVESASRGSISYRANQSVKPSLRATKSSSSKCRRKGTSLPSSSSMIPHSPKRSSVLARTRTSSPLLGRHAAVKSGPGCEAELPGQRGALDAFRVVSCSSACLISSGGTPTLSALMIFA